MDVVSICSNYRGVNINERIQPVDRKLCKFISIIHAVDEIKAASSEGRLVVWLKNKASEVELILQDMSKYHDFIFPYLHLSSKSSVKKVQNRIKIALQYAKTVGQYVPDASGNIDQLFNYYHLIKLIKTVFGQHIRRNESLLSGGVKLELDCCSFYAKLEGKRICIIQGKGPLISKGGFGAVLKVFEIMTRRFLALKISHGNTLSVGLIKKEIANLTTLHVKADYDGLSVEGLQAAPLATFDFGGNESGLVGFIGELYGMELSQWSKADHSNGERLAICKSLMTAYKNKMLLGYWHGDIKPNNILMTAGGIVIIDWAGSLLLQDALEKFSTPNSWTSAFLSKNEEKNLQVLGGLNRHGFEDALKFIETAQSMDLFSLAIVLFKTLTSRKPFFYDTQGYPITIDGIRPDKLEILIQKGYGENIVNLLVKMLAHNPYNRPSPLDAIALWGEIG